MDLLQIENGKIINTSGKVVNLRGTCIGGFLNLEDFINAYPGTESTLRKHMLDTLGSVKGKMFFDRMADNFFAEDDIAFITASGANCIRIPLNYRCFETDDKPFSYNEEGFKRLDGILKLCEKYSIYVILDMHAAPGWQNCHWHSDNERGVALLWTHKLFQDRFVALWQEFARRYEGRNVVAGYNLINEPSTGNPNGEHAFDFYEHYKPDWDAMNSLYSRTVKAIRDVDPKHIIFLEGDNYSRYFEGLDAPFAANLVYSSHNYTSPGFGSGPYPGYYQSEAGLVYWDKNRQKMDILNCQGYIFSRQHNVPLWVGEFGSQYHGEKEQLHYRLKAMDDQLAVYNECDINWTTWTYKDAGIMGWVTLDPESDYMKIVEPVQQMKRNLGAENFVAQYWDSPGRVKSRELADLILAESGNYQCQNAANAYTFNYAALTGYAAAMLQPAYARRFANMTETEIDNIMQAFNFKNCIINKDYLEILKQRLTE